MISILAFVHIIVSIFLVVLVLIQDPKGGGAGGMFGGGGGSNSLFGATGAPTFLAKVTRWVAVIFAGLCILMTATIKPEGNSVLDSVDMKKAATQAPLAEESIEAAPAEDQTQKDEQQPEK